MKKNILLIGGTGLLGLNWINYDSKFFQYTLGINKQNLKKKGVKEIKINFSDINSIYKNLKSTMPDVVVNLAAITDVDYCENNPDVTMAVNANLAKKISKVAELLGIKNVFFSTDQLFDGKNGNATENTKKNPINIYGKSKDIGEELVLLESPKSLIIRTNFFGFGTNRRISFSDWIINSLIKSKEIFLFTDIIFSPIYIKNLIRITEQLILKDQSGIFNIASDGCVSKYDFGLYLANKFNLDTKLIIKSLYSEKMSNVLRPLNMSLNNNKVSKIIDFQIGNYKDQINDLFHDK